MNDGGCYSCDSGGYCYNANSRRKCGCSNVVGYIDFLLLYVIFQFTVQKILVVLYLSLAIVVRVIKVIGIGIRWH